MTSTSGTTRHHRAAEHRATTTRAVGVVAGIALGAGLVVAAGGPASARPCDIGASACRPVQVSAGQAQRIRYP